KKKITLVPNSNAPELKAEAGSVVVPFEIHPKFAAFTVNATVNGSKPLTLVLGFETWEIGLSPKLPFRAAFQEFGKASFTFGDLEMKDLDVHFGGGSKLDAYRGQLGLKFDGTLGLPFFEKTQITLD